MYLCPERKISFDGFACYEGRRFGVGTTSDVPSTAGRVDPHILPTCSPRSPCTRSPGRQRAPRGGRLGARGAPTAPVTASVAAERSREEVLAMAEQSAFERIAADARAIGAAGGDSRLAEDRGIAAEVEAVAETLSYPRGEEEGARRADAPEHGPHTQKSPKTFDNFDFGRVGAGAARRSRGRRRRLPTCTPGAASRSSGRRASARRTSPRPTAGRAASGACRPTT